MRFVNLLQPLFDDVGVNLGGRNIRMPEHELNGPEVRSALEQVRGKTMPQHVRRKSHTHARLASIGRKYLPDADAAQRRSAAIHEQRRTAGYFAEQLRPGVAEILFDDGERLLANRNNAFLVALADAANTADLGIEIGDAQPSELRYTQAGRVQNLEHGAVPQAERSLRIGLAEHALDFLEAEIARQGTSDLRRFEVHGRIFRNQVLDLGETEKVTQGDQVPSHGLALQLLPVEPREEIDEIVAGDGLEAEFALAGKFIEFYEIATIRGYGVGRQPLLHPHVGQERRNGCRNFHQGSKYPSPAPAVRRAAIP